MHTNLFFCTIYHYTTVTQIAESDFFVNTCMLFFFVYCIFFLLFLYFNTVAKRPGSLCS